MNSFLTTYLIPHYLNSTVQYNLKVGQIYYSDNIASLSNCKRYLKKSTVALCTMSQSMS